MRNATFLVSNGRQPNPERKPVSKGKEMKTRKGSGFSVCPFLYKLGNQSLSGQLAQS